MRPSRSVAAFSDCGFQAKPDVTTSSVTSRTRGSRRIESPSRQSQTQTGVGKKPRASEIENVPDHKDQRPRHRFVAYFCRIITSRFREEPATEADEPV